LDLRLLKPKEEKGQLRGKQKIKKKQWNTIGGYEMQGRIAIPGGCKKTTSR